MTDFEQPRIALLMIEIPFECTGHRNGAGGSQHTRLLGERIHESRGSDLSRPEQRIPFFSDVWNRDNFAVAQPNQLFAQPRFRFVMRQASGSLPRRRQARRKFIEAMDANNLLDQTDFARRLGAPRRLLAFPGCENSPTCPAILIYAHRSEPQRTENGFDFLVWNIRAHDAKKFGAANMNLFRRPLSGIDIHNSGEQFAARQ